MQRTRVQRERERERSREQNKIKHEKTQTERFRGGMVVRGENRRPAVSLYDVIRSIY